MINRRLVYLAALLVIVSWAWMLPHQALAQLPGSLIVTITSPTSGSTVSGTVTVTVSVSIIGSLTVAGVQFYLDGSPLGAEDTSAPYSVPWNTTTTSNGSHTLTAVARDLLGLRFTSDPVTVTVFNDKTPPTVSLISPAAGSTVSGTITVSATASDNVGVVGVQFRLDGANLGAEDTSAPYSASWNTTTASNGSHTLTAVARDAAGNRATSAAVTVTVSNAPPPDTTPPAVSMTSPTSGSTVAGTITVSATASDNVGVAGVLFQVDGVALGAEDTTAPYAVSWDTTTVSNGSHTLTAVARDAADNRTTSTPVTITVSNGPSPDTTPPTVSITSPTSGSTVSGTITVSATASDNVGVAGVLFQVDGVALGAEDTTAPYAVSWDTTTASNGSHTLTAVARDAAGNRATSATVTVTVSNAPPPDTTPPTVSITSPTSGSTVSGTITVSASASDNVGVVGVQFRLDGADLGTEDTTAPYAVSWDTTTASNGSYTLTAVARDAAGNRTTSAGVTVTVSNGGTTVTRFEESAASFTGSGWVPRGAEIATFSGGAAVSSNVSGDTSSFTFTGTAVNWIGLKCNVCGIASVSIDGGAATLVDTTGAAPPGSPGLASEVVFTASGLVAGSHTMVITVSGTTTSGGAHVILDAFDVTGAGGGGSPPPDTTPPAVSMTSPTSGSTVAGTITVSATASDNVGVVGVQFQLDGVALGAEDTTAPYSISWDTTTAPDGSHTLTAVARDAAGNRTTSAGVTVTVSNGSATVTRFEETDPAVSYTGNWIHPSDPRVSGGTFAEANEAGARATFSFTGTAVSWIGARGPWGGIARVYVDGTLYGNGEVDTYAPSEETQVKMLTASGLSTGAHTLTIEVTGTWSPSSGSAWIVVDAFDVTP